MGSGDGQPAHDVDLGVGALAHGHRTLGEGTAVDRHSPDGRLDVMDFDNTAVGQANQGSTTVTTPTALKAAAALAVRRRGKRC